MPPVTVIILHAEARPRAGQLERLLVAARADSAARLAAGFRGLGADEVRLVSGPPDAVPFGRRLAGLLPAAGGIVVLGSGSIPLAVADDLARLLAAAGRADRAVLANNRYSADVVAISRTDELPPLPDLPGDNALPRWLAEVAGREVADLRGRWRLQMDLDGPLDLLLVDGNRRPGGDASGARPAGTGAQGSGTIGGGRLQALAGGRLQALAGAAIERLDEVRAVLGDRRAEVVVTGRTSASALRWLERRSPARVRALVEERGLRAATRLAWAGDAPGSERRASPQRPPRSVLGLLLDRDGPAALGPLLAQLGDAALVDTRVLLAHRLGPDEDGWPGPEDRFASDLLRPGKVRDPWLRAITASALEAPIPVLLGGHSLVGPGVRLVAPPAGGG